MSKTISFFDFFIPDHLRHNPNDLMRAYILVGIIFTNLLTTSFVMLSLFTFFILPEQNQNLAVMFNAYCIIAYSLVLIAFYQTENYPLCSNAVVFIMYLVVFPAIQITGGFFESPVSQLIVLVPVTGFLLTGLRSGSLWLMVTLVSAIFLCVLSAMNIGAYQLIERPKDAEFMKISLRFVLLFMVGVALVIYELINQNLKELLNEEKNRFEHRASHDSLTGIPNRFEFFRRLNQNIIECNNREQKLGIAYIDLDGFKPINDQHGHQAGDYLLQQIAQRLQKVLRLSDTVARLGGDEFALILPGIRIPEDINLVMNKTLGAIRHPITLPDGNSVQVYGSLGISIYPDHGRDINELCRFADSAMYQAKQQHDTFVVFHRAES